MPRHQQQEERGTSLRKPFQYGTPYPKIRGTEAMCWRKYEEQDSMHTDQEHGQAQGPDSSCLGTTENVWVCITQEGHWHSAKELLLENHGDSLLLTGGRGAPGEVGFILVSSWVFGGKEGVENVAS